VGRPGTLRVIAGSAGGLRLACPREAHIRPTADRVREAIFNILGAAVTDARVLDLFAGSGAYGIEALSRGAAACVFVERSRVCAAAIAGNLRATRLAGQGRVIAADALAFPGERLQPGEQFDLVFLDPPYRHIAGSSPDSRLTALIERLALLGVLAPSGTLVYEHASAAEVPGSFRGVVLKSRRRYGSTSVSFYGRSG